jgi:hypothetical protein
MLSAFHSAPEQAGTDQIRYLSCDLLNANLRCIRDTLPRALRSTQHLFQYRFNHFAECRDVAIDHLPHEVVVDLEVMMDQNVPQADRL